MVAVPRIEEQSPDLTRQIVVIHLSDLHFGRNHRFIPQLTIDGNVPEEQTFPTLLETLLEDLKGDDPGCPVIVCISGDLVETGSIKEFKQAEQFLKRLTDSEILGKKRGVGSIFISPGNHDVQYDDADIGVRWQQWTEFYNRLYGENITRENPWAFTKLFDLTDEIGAIVLTLNSAIYVQKDKSDEDRGRLDIKQLAYIEDTLEAIDKSKLESSIRIALVHHHPVLIPPLAEPGRGYDAIHNSGKLLTILRRYGFHLVLHGHKHNPHTFTDDTKSAHQNLPDQPIFIVSGGSCGSTGLPQSPKCTNTYNVISTKWHPLGCQLRVRSETRSLNLFNKDGTEKLPTRWKWECLRVDDRHFYAFDHVPHPGRLEERKFVEELDGDFNEKRIGEYARTRGNLPVVQVTPSLIPDQVYEAILWLVPHPYGATKPENDIPTEVTWSAGTKFPVMTVRREDDPNYTVRITYWGPMIVQARIKFSDGYETAVHIYARMPCLYHAEESAK